jgi:type IV pilus assembly protein PilB
MVMIRGNQQQLAALLLQDGLLTREALDYALAKQAEGDKPLSKVLLDEGMVRETDLVRVLARAAGYPFVDLEDYTIDPSAASMIGDSLAKRYKVLPLAWDGPRLVVAMADPSDVVAIDDLRAVTGCEISVVVATPTHLEHAITTQYRHDQLVKDIAEQATETFQQDELVNLREAIEDAPLVKLMNLMISQAVTDRASDIHFEPTEHDVRVRYRIDGVLYEVMRLRKNIQNGITSRIKIMADMNIAEHRVPQDGRMTVDVGGRGIDLRVVSIPTAWGEKMVMRLLDHSKALYRLEELGFMPEALVRYEDCYRRSHGIILVTGPTGSGKTTTLYATLNVLNEDTKNILTAEDPVEYRIPGINQMQVNYKTGLTFPVALKAMMRGDPDIILVGEIRDLDTAKMATEASLTGHLVLSTLHTNDAASTPLRLIEMGVEPFLVSSSLSCVVAQRLARQLCDRCKEPFYLSPGQSRLADELGLFPEGSSDPITLYRPVGCNICSKTGFRGRMALYEVMTITEEIGQMIVEGAHTDDIRKMAVAQGMQTLVQCGMHHVTRGTTTVEEVLRVVA